MLNKTILLLFFLPVLFLQGCKTTSKKTSTKANATKTTKKKTTKTGKKRIFRSGPLWIDSNDKRVYLAKSTNKNMPVTDKPFPWIKPTVVVIANKKESFLNVGLAYSGIEANKFKALSKKFSLEAPKNWHRNSEDLDWSGSSTYTHLIPALKEGAEQTLEKQKKLAKAIKGFSPGHAAILVEKDTSLWQWMKVMVSLSWAGFKPISIVMCAPKNKSGHCALRGVTLSSRSNNQTAVGMLGAKKKKVEDPNLSVYFRSNGLFLISDGEYLVPGCRSTTKKKKGNTITIGKNGIDRKALKACLLQIRKQYPKAQYLVIAMNKTNPFEHVQTILEVNVQKGKSTFIFQKIRISSEL